MSTREGRRRCMNLILQKHCALMRLALGRSLHALSHNIPHAGHQPSSRNYSGHKLGGKREREREGQKRLTSPTAVVIIWQQHTMHQPCIATSTRKPEAGLHCINGQPAIQQTVSERRGSGMWAHLCCCLLPRHCCHICTLHRQKANSILAPSDTSLSAGCGTEVQSGEG